MSLFRQLNVLSLTLPPLRRRAESIPPPAASLVFREKNSK